MQHTMLMAWQAWKLAFQVPLWNPYGAAITATLFTVLLGYMIKSMMGRER